MTSTSATGSMARANRWLREALGLSEGETPFPWQEELFRRFANGTIERALDIPTGLGKTAVIAIWLIARAYTAVLPRRVVYVVDRRAVVDQATEVARKLREYVDRDPELKEALGLGKHSLPISTLRGKHVDNKVWLEDPGSPAIIVGTLDMIGSRLLFEGYGISRKMRPYHAGLLGADTLLVLDEAHLVPSFEKLIETVANDTAAFGPGNQAPTKLVPPFKLLSLSATGRVAPDQSFGLQDSDLKHPVVSQRLNAPKRVTKLGPLDDQTELKDALAKQAWQLAGNGTKPIRCIVFCDERTVAEATMKAIEQYAKGDKKLGIAPVKVDTELFVGGRRVLEREEAANRLKDLGFIAGTEVKRSRPAFVFATSAGEVGVDLDADHMVSDLVTWERMVQRLGRVNRRGEGSAEVIVVVKPNKKVQAALKKDPTDRKETESRAVIAYEASIRTLACLPSKNGMFDASPGALRQLKLDKTPELQAALDAAATTPPLRPALSRALVDAWSMTSLKHHTGRPQISPWLRGWTENEPPQTAVVWRTHMPARKHASAATPKDIQAFFEAAPPHASEILETETYRVVKWLIDRAKAVTSSDKTGSESMVEGATQLPQLQREDIVAIALTTAGDFVTAWRLEELIPAADVEIKTIKDALEQNVSAATLIVNARIGGLEKGLLDNTASGPIRTVDDGQPWISQPANEQPAVAFRVRVADADEPFVADRQWRERFRLAINRSDEGEPTRWLIVEKWRHDAATEEDRSAGRPQLLNEHQFWTEERARELARRLELPDIYIEMLSVAARLHDEGKCAGRWQHAFNARKDGFYAKTLGPVNIALLDGYRHEFGSLPFAAKDERFRRLPADLQDLALHLIAAHHGFARPIISTEGCEDAPPSALEKRAREVALRFVRLQKRWGPWGLAWWEALLRAADQQASRDNDAADAVAEKDNG